MESIDFINAILYLFPGFLFIEIFRKYYPTKRDTDFARIIKSVLWSIPLFAIAYLVDNLWTINISDLLIAGKPINTSLIICLYAISIILAYSKVGIRYLRFKARGNERYKYIIPKAQSLWHKINWDQEWAVIITKGGERYLGYISDYTYDIESPDDIDLLLSNADCVDEKLKIKYKINGKGIYIKLSEISRIEFYQ